MNALWQHSTDESHHPVLQLEKQRAKAVEQGDIATIESFISPSLRYIHATGLSQDRDAYLSYLQSGIRFHRVELQVSRWMASADFAIVQGELHLQFEKPGQAPMAAHSHATEIWQSQHGGWQLLSFQSTRLPD